MIQQRFMPDSLKGSQSWWCVDIMVTGISRLGLQISYENKSENSVKGSRSESAEVKGKTIISNDVPVLWFLTFWLSPSFFLFKILWTGRLSSFVASTGIWSICSARVFISILASGFRLYFLTDLIGLRFTNPGNIGKLNGWIWKKCSTMPFLSSSLGHSFFLSNKVKWKLDLEKLKNFLFFCRMRELLPYPSKSRL